MPTDDGWDDRDLRRAFTALHLEVDSTIVNDLERIVKGALREALKPEPGCNEDVTGTEDTCMSAEDCKAFGFDGPGEGYVCQHHQTERRRALEDKP